MHKLEVRCVGKVQRGHLAVGLASEVLPGSLLVMIEDGSRLVLDGTSLALTRKVVPLPDDVLSAMAKDKHVLGLNARIASKSLEVTLRAGSARPIVFRTGLPLTAEARSRLLKQPMTLLARDGYHGLTPFFDDARRLEPDLSKPAPANRWRNPGDRQLASLFNASWRLGKHRPDSLKRLLERMLAVADQKPAMQNQRLEEFKKSIDTVRADVKRCGAAREVIERALADLESK
jgi:hypothetical protein